MEIRAMALAELEMVLDWAAAEGWNPGWQDAASFYAADPGGFLLGLVEGEPVASIFAVQYGEDFGFIGGYIVRPGWRGQGHGMAVWRAGMARLAGRNVGLDGVPAQQANYARSGFNLAHRNVRYEGQGSGLPADDRVLPLAAPDFDAVVDYDRAFFPAARERFMRHWLAQEGSIVLGVRDGPGTLLGYAVLRPCRAGFKVGPLCAESPAVADELLHALRGRVPQGAPIYLDVPEPNSAALALAAQHGMRPCFETARMYTGPAPQLPLSRQYGITSFELG
ncbi:GNAT family N-acetyltransferase [Pseudoduganella sp. DS3]|uniref:GNAT family N-acetyltransferase n=1 Tax=Pseudoduganella guangdongensis TaxID=2692179 RepID=A0A6N9HHT2_9BURK|nr:GNAT family N-acetyltransferase [Pseudoduganella guangdongensis]MYN02633.1 GNAT family N-acetyltransferase [Pseudoduganella guangdongensis]